MSRRLARLIASAALLVLVPHPARAEMAAPAPRIHALEVLTPADIDPARLLPPPPADGSAGQKAEIDELRHIQTTRTPERLALAQWDDVHENATLFAPTLGLKFDLDALPQTAKLLAVVANDQEMAAGRAKKAFHRHRPWIFDPSLTGCPRGKAPDPLSSYPSGHATLGYAEAVVLAALIPERAGDIMARASEYADSRLVCEVHFRSDIVASQALGTAVGAMLLKAPALQPQIDAAAKELKAAGLAER
jgi:acid phosphatase (class A)